MKNPYDVLRMKEQELLRVRKEIEALRSPRACWAPRIRPQPKRRSASAVTSRRNALAVAEVLRLRMSHRFSGDADSLNQMPL